MNQTPIVVNCGQDQTGCLRGMTKIQTARMTALAVSLVLATNGGCSSRMNESSGAAHCYQGGDDESSKTTLESRFFGKKNYGETL